MKEHYLSEEDYKRLVLNIENPPEPTEALKEKKMSKCKARYTQGGTSLGYEPQYRESNKDEWQRVPIHWSHPKMAQAILPARGDNVPTLLGLCTYEQAWAAAWIFSAEAASHGKTICIQVQAYRIEYDAKAFKDGAFCYEVQAKE